MPATSELILPPQPLASCIVGCISRDTRGVVLSDADRLNYFPASPFFTVTLTFSGQLHRSDVILGLNDLRKHRPAPKVMVLPPQIRPHVSWSPGPVWAMTIAFFPDAWQRLGGTRDGDPPDALLGALSGVETGPVGTALPAFWQEMISIWTNSSDDNQLGDWAGSTKIKDWTYHLMGRLSQTGAGRSLRTAQRRLGQWTGFNRQTLDFFAKVDDLHRLITENPDATPAEVAADAGFSDQSHMGRALKRATGFSPMTLNRMIATEEPFWCYRLLGERF